MKINKYKNFREKFKETYGPESKLYADEVNNVFAIDSKDDILKSVEVFENMFRSYTNKEVLVISEKIISAANSADDKELVGSVEKILENIVTKLSKDKLGGNVMPYKEFGTEAEYNDFVKSIKDGVISDFKDKNIVAEIESKLSQATQDIDEMRKTHELELRGLNDSIAEKDEEIVKYKAEVNHTKRIIAVAEKLDEAGLTDFAEEAKQWVEESLDKDDEGFDKYVDAHISLIKKALSKEKGLDEPKPKEDLANASEEIPVKDLDEKDKVKNLFENTIEEEMRR